MVLALSLGLHWAVLQTAAWAGMLVSYSRQASFAEAVAWTFDGQHPCRLCHLVREGRAAEKAPDTLPAMQVKLDPAPLPAAAGIVPLPDAPRRLGGFPPPAALSARTEAPLLPPPRVA